MTCGHSKISRSSKIIFRSCSSETKDNFFNMKYGCFGSLGTQWGGGCVTWLLSFAYPSQSFLKSTPLGRLQANAPDETNWRVIGETLPPPHHAKVLCSTSQGWRKTCQKEAKVRIESGTPRPKVDLNRWLLSPITTFLIR